MIWPEADRPNGPQALVLELPFQQKSRNLRKSRPHLSSEQDFNGIIAHFEIFAERVAPKQVPPGRSVGLLLAKSFVWVPCK